MDALANAFALLADQETEDVSTIAGPITVKAENKKKKNKARGEGGKGEEGHGGNVVDLSSNGQGRGKEGHGHGPRSLDGNVVNQRQNGQQSNGRSYGNVNPYGRAERPVNKSFWKVKGNAGDGQANGQSSRRSRVKEIGADEEFENEGVMGSDGGDQMQKTVENHVSDGWDQMQAVENPVSDGWDQMPEAVESPVSDGGDQMQEAVDTPVNEEVKDSQCENQESKAVDHHDQEDQGEVSVETEVLTKEELRERTRRAKEKAESKEKSLAREEERKKERAMKTLKEYEEQKAKEKKKADEEQKVVKAREVTLDKDLESMQVLSKEKIDNIYTKQRKSKKETVKKDSNIDNDAKVHKTMSIEEFMELPTRSEGQHEKGRDSTNEDSMKNANDGGSGRGRGGGSRNYVNSNNGGTVRGRSNSGNYRNENRGGFGSRNGDSRNNVNLSPGGIERGGRSGFSRNRVPDLGLTSFPVLSKEDPTKPKDLGNE